MSRFEDLRVWQLAKQYCDLIFEITERAEFQRHQVLAERMKKTAIQTVEAIAEGFERETSRDFANFARIAKGSNGEARAQIHIARRFLTDGDSDKLLGLNNDIGKMLRGLRPIAPGTRQTLGKATLGIARGPRNEAPPRPEERGPARGTRNEARGTK